MKLELIIPSSLSDISLSQYKKFHKIQEANFKSHFINIKMIEIFCNLDEETARMLKFSDATKVINILTNMLNEKPQLVRTFKMNGIDYGLIPNLDEMSLGEYVDLDTYIGNWDEMQIAMNVLYRPIKEQIGEKYTIEDYSIESKDALKEIPMDVVLGAIFFLYNLGIELSQVMMDYFQNQKIEDLMQEQTLQENMDGINQSSLLSLKEMLDELKISLN
jgi:hypothetical protein